jgi:hypothetical protein
VSQLQSLKTRKSEKASPSIFGPAALLILSVCVAWALISVAPIWKYLSHTKAIAAMLLGLLSIALGMYWLGPLNRRHRQIGIAWFVLLFLTLTAAFTVLYPISLKHTLNGGSDREDALRIELNAVQHHQYPYDARTYLHNPPTPLPGALLLAAPFYALGHIAWQNFLWYPLFFFFAVHFFRYRATALFFLAVFLLFAPANLSDFTSGGDYLTNFFYISIAVALFTSALDRSFYACCIPAALFLGVALSSRILYVFILIPLLALTLQRTSRSRTVLLFCIVLLTAAAITLPIFTPHPVTHLLQQLSQNSGKLLYIPSSLHAQQTLPLLAALAACIAFFMRMDLPRLFLTFSISSFFIVAPPVAALTIHSGKPVYEFSYLSICILSFALWALSQYEPAPTARIAQDEVINSKPQTP